MIIFIRMNLNAHLRSHLGFRSRFTNLARFPDVMRERFLAIDMLAMLQRQHGRKMLAGGREHLDDPVLLRFFRQRQAQC